MANRVLDLTVYAREGCHLCDAMIDEIREFQAEAKLELRLEIVDVDGDDALKVRYGLLVPVLTAEGREICHYFFDLAAVNAYLGNIR